MSETEEKKLGCFPFVIGGLSFIPLLGIPLGIVLVIWGLTTKKIGGKWLALIGAGGVSFSIIVYGSLFYFGVAQRGGVFDELRKMQTKQNFPMAIQAIEYYKMQHGAYPSDLDALVKAQPSSAILEMSLMDPAGITRLPDGEDKVLQKARLYYQLVDENHYYLLASGPDGKPFTDDDVIPDLPLGEKTGLLIKKSASVVSPPPKDK